MEEFFYYQSPGNFFYVEDQNFPVNRSAFIPYTYGWSKSCVMKSNHQNMNKRMIGFLRRSKNPVTVEGKESDEREKCFRHVINERMRREKEKQSYSALYSLLPTGTKSDKNSIVRVAFKEVQELMSYKEELERRNREIEGILVGRECDKTEGAKIRLRVVNPSSGIDSMVEVLKSLKKMGSKTIAIQSKFSAKELSAVLEVGSQSEAAQVEMVVNGTLQEVERKLHFHFPS